MPKFIAVVDELGNAYRPTYPKRAKGLVKHGRARWLNEHCLCLAHPPCIREDYAMNELTKTDTALVQQPVITSSIENDFPSVREILQLLHEVQHDTQGFQQALETLGNLKIVPALECGAPPDVANQFRASAIGDVVKARVRQNCELIGFYRQMYEDIMRYRGLRPLLPTAADLGSETLSAKEPPHHKGDDKEA